MRNLSRPNPRQRVTGPLVKSPANLELWRTLHGGAKFDGSNDYLLRGGTLTGIADSKVGTFAARIRFNGGDSANQQILNSNGAALDIRRKGDNKFGIICENAGGTIILNNGGSGTYTSASGWLNLLFSWDMTGSVAQMYINDTNDAAAAGVFTNDNIDYTVSEYSVGAATGGNNKCNMDIRFLWFDPTTAINFATEANRRKFFDANGNPVYLGDKGQLPTGSSPVLYLSNPFDLFQRNRGTGGNFTVTGALTQP